MIEICNLRSQKLIHSYDVRVDRQSILGNPFYMKSESERNNVCNKYKMYFDKQFKDCVENNTKFSKSFVNELQRLVNIYKEHGKLRLFCWCTPKRCHAETVKEYILDQYLTQIK